MRWILWICLVPFIWLGCSNESNKKNTEKPLARVYDKYLYPSDLESILRKKMSKEDSILIVGTYLENWAKDNLMLHVAEQNVPKDVNIDEMVRKYRENLILSYYERRLVQEQLDTFVTAAEIQKYYEETKEEQILNYSVVSCYFIKVATDAPELEDVKKWWKLEEKNDLNELKNYAELYAQIYILEDSTWRREIDLAAQLPEGTFTEGSLTKGKTFNFEDKGYLYLLRVNDVVKKGNIAPIGFIRAKAKSYILLKRKMGLIDKMSDEMYKREINKQNVEIYN